MTSSLRIAMWSGPRNISTAMMRAWQNRRDTAVIDEPFYAYYLLNTGTNHPGRDEVMASQSTDWRVVATALTGPIPGGKAIWYQKHMTQHILPDMPLDWLNDLTNCFLIRSPHEVVASFTVIRPDAAIWELGFEQQLRIFEHVCRQNGKVPPIVDAADILKDPAGMLGALCERLGISFSERMLHWPAGSRESDGVWAKHWYQAVERSTGFGPHKSRKQELTAFQKRLAEQCQPFYERLWTQRIMPPA